jgi:hypothetical protein
MHRAKLHKFIVDKVHIEKYRRNLPKDGKYFTTLNNIKVRSKSEQYIADWLYRHNLQFEYEPLLNVKDFDFNPDFHIPAANLYLEHISNKSYPMRDKEEQFEKGGMLLVRTFEQMTKDSALFNHTLDSIIRGRISETGYSNKAVTYREELNSYHEDVKDFIRMVIRITDMIKVESLDLSAIGDNAAHDQHERVHDFYKLALPLIVKYQEYCVNNF